MDNFPEHLPMKKNQILLLAIGLLLPLAGIALYVVNKARKPGFEVIEDQNTLEILTPTLQERKVAKIKLPNGLQVLIISDPEAKKSAASLSVKVGQWQDPEAYPGMAHFCEHLLFMGTKSHPEENQFSLTVQDHGGTYNAFTAADQTTYVFTVNPSAFPDVLDNFSGFFIEPLFAPGSVARELHAVDQENDLNKKNDSRREWMVLRETSNPDHPFARFGTGNAETLGKIPLTELKAWNEKNYSADEAHLILYGNHTIEEMTQMAVRYFTDVPHAPTPTRSCPSEITSPKQRGHITYIEPIKDQRELTLLWELPDAYNRDQENSVAQLVAYAINQKGTNSLYKQLHDENLAKDVYAGVFYIGKRAFFYIYVSFNKDIATLDIDTVVHRCMQNVALIQSQGVPSYLFEEMQKMAQISYAYQSASNPYDFVERCATDLHYESLATYPLKRTLFTPCSMDDTKKFGSLLTAEKCLFVVLAPEKLTGVTPQQQEKWYKVPYAVKEITPQQLATWKNVTLHSNIGFPTKNPYIPQTLSFIGTLQGKNTTPQPRLLEQSDKGSAYYYLDDRYGEPKVMCSFKIKSPRFDGSAQQKIALQLFIRHIEEALRPWVYQMERAGYTISLYEEDLALVCTVSGYSDKIAKVCEDLLSRLVANATSASEREFTKHKANLKVTYQNQSKQRAVSQAFRLYRQSLYSHTPDTDALLEALQYTSYSQVQTFSKELFDTAYVEGLVGGNLSEESARKIWNKVKSLMAKPYATTHHLKRRLVKLPEETGPYKMLKKVEEQGHAVCLVIQAGEHSFEKEAAMDILDVVLRNLYFDTLRSKQQVGYIASSGAFEFEGDKALLHYFALQSTTHTANDQLMRTELMIEDFVKNFSAHLTEERFETIRAELLTSLRKDPRSLKHMCNRIRYLAFEQEANFERTQQQIKALEAITYEQVKQHAMQIYARSNLRRIAYLVVDDRPQGKHFAYQTIDKRGLSALMLGDASANTQA